MRVAAAVQADLADWADMRAALWPDDGAQVHRAEVGARIASGSGDAAAFVARDGSGRAIGFAEAALRRDYVNGCDETPVVFLEGLFTRPDARRNGAARALVEAVAAWGLSRGAHAFASDADLANTIAHRVHRALGFAETERVVFFRRPLAD